MYSILHYNEIQKKVGENIEQVRLLKKKTVKEVAAAINLSGSGYRNIERGITDISITKLFQLAAILEVNQSQLLELDIHNFIKNEAQEKLTEKYNKQADENYRVRIQQYKEETCFLKKQIEVLENLLSNSESNANRKRSFRTG